MGAQRAQFGEQPPRMVTALACALGHIGLPGGGLGTNYHYCSGGSLPGVGPSIRGIGSNVKPVLPYKDDGAGTLVIPVARFAECFLNPGESFYYMDKKCTYPEIRMVMWAGGNPFSHQPQTNRLAEAWKKPETVVVTDCFWTPTALNADIVLPACTFFERNDITGIGTYTNDGIVYMKKAIEPMYESKSDYEIYSLLAAKMGCADSFTCGRSEEDWIRVIYQEAAYSRRGFGVTLTDYETFKAEGVILFVNRRTKSLISLLRISVMILRLIRSQPEAAKLRSRMRRFRTAITLIVLLIRFILSRRNLCARKIKNIPLRSSALKARIGCTASSAA